MKYRSRTFHTDKQKSEMWDQWQCGESMSSIGRQAYRATHSDQRAWDCAPRPKSCKLSFNDPLCQLIARKLRRKLSPQRIAGWLKRNHPDGEQNHVSHETIYRSVYV